MAVSERAPAPGKVAEGFLYGVFAQWRRVVGRQQQRGQLGASGRDPHCDLPASRVCNPWSIFLRVSPRKGGYVAMSAGK